MGDLGECDDRFKAGIGDEMEGRRDGWEGVTRIHLRSSDSEGIGTMELEEGVAQALHGLW